MSVIKGKRSPHRPLDMVGVEPGMNAVLAGADEDAHHLVQHEGDLMGIDTLEVERDNPAAQIRIGRSDDFQAGYGCNFGGDKFV